MAPATKKVQKPGKQQLKGKGKAVKKLGKKNSIKLFIDCTHPVEDGIMNCADFEKYLHERIKVDKIAFKRQNFITSFSGRWQDQQLRQGADHGACQD